MWHRYIARSTSHVSLACLQLVLMVIPIKQMGAFCGTVIHDVFSITDSRKYFNYSICTGRANNQLHCLHLWSPTSGESSDQMMKFSANSYLLSFIPKPSINTQRHGCRHKLKSGGGGLILRGYLASEKREREREREEKIIIFIAQIIAISAPHLPCQPTRGWRRPQ